jgi:hypothetical protein
MKRQRSLRGDIQAANNQAWKARHDALAKKYKRLLERQSATELLVSEVKTLAPTSYTSAPAIARDTRRRRVKSSPQSAVLLLSDTHVGKTVEQEQSLSLGEYNFEVFLDRLKYLEESLISILQDHTNTKVPELVVFMLGDMLDGALAHSNEADQQVTLFSQFFGAGHALAQFLRNLAPFVPSIRVATAVGNHTRWAGTQRRMPSVNRFSNLDEFLYAYTRALLADVKNIRWPMNKQPFCRETVQGWRARG